MPELGEPEEVDEGWLVESGPYADVRLFGRAARDFAALQSRTDEDSVREARGLARYLKQFVSSANPAFSPKMFKSQGRVKDGHGNEHLIHEFKYRQFRLYGHVCTYGGRKCFVGTACDTDKKKDKADPDILKRAAQGVTRVLKK